MHQPAVETSTNLVDLAPAVVAGLDFNARPVTLHVLGVREMNRPLFRRLAPAATPAEAAAIFADYMTTIFAIDRSELGRPSAAAHRGIKASWLQLIAAWGRDSDQPEGAVLKGWVESRFGIAPTWHRGPLGGLSSQVRAAYVAERMASRFHRNSILSQLDLLYEFVQWQLDRFSPAGGSHLTLYRGIDGFDPDGPATQRDGNGLVIRLNSLTSFNADRAVAACQGDLLLTARVPLQKLLFVNGLTGDRPLRDDGEHLVIGGDYRVRISN